MDRDQMLDLLAEVLSGLQVPMSIGLPLGTARVAWEELHNETGFGWHQPEDYRQMLERVLR